MTIAGGFAYDNVFMINGVDVNDNLFGTANNVFIEDAIEADERADVGHLRRVRPVHAAA